MLVNKFVCFLVIESVSHVLLMYYTQDKSKRTNKHLQRDGQMNKMRKVLLFYNEHSKATNQLNPRAPN